MDQATEMARILHQASRASRRRDPAAADVQGHPPLHGRGQPAGERRRPCAARGAGVAVRARDRPDGGDPLEGHLRAARGRDRRHRDGREHPRGHRHQEPARRWAPTSSSGSSWAPRSRSTSPTASTTPPTRSRHRSRRARCRPRAAVAMAAVAQLRRRVPVARGRRDDRHRHRRGRRRDAADRVRRPDRRDRLEPGDVVLRPAVLVLARADRRRSSARRSRRSAPSGVHLDGLLREGRRSPRWSRPCSRSSSPACRSSSSTGSSAASVPGRSRAASGSGSSSPAALFSLSHGTNDAQKTMGIIFLALVANGNLPDDRRRPDLGRRLVRDARSRSAPTSAAGGSSARWAARIIKMDPAQGFAAQGVGAAVILSASHVGFPLSTTHVISGGIMGAGAAKRLSAVRWGVAGNIVVAWVLTLPASAAVGALTYGVVRLFGAHGRGRPDRGLDRAAGRTDRRRSRGVCRGRPDADGGGVSVFAAVEAATTSARGRLGLADRRPRSSASRSRCVVLGSAPLGRGAAQRRRRPPRWPAARWPRSLFAAFAGARRVRRASSMLSKKLASRILDRAAARARARRRRSSSGGRSVVTTVLAPITQRSPIVTPLVMTTLAPHQTLSPIARRALAT